MLSIPGGSHPSSIDFNSYVSFLGGVAGLGPDAIEVWNEQNIDFEWPAGEIDPRAADQARPAQQGGLERLLEHSVSSTGGLDGGC